MSAFDPTARLAQFIASFSAILLILYATPFLLSGHYTSAVAGYLPALMLLADLRATRRGEPWPFSQMHIMLALALVHIVQSWFHGTFILIWVFPAFFGVLLLSSARTASLYAAIMLVWGGWLAGSLGQGDLAVAFVLALFFSWIVGLNLVRTIDSLREEILEQSLRDPLTGAYNRRHFNDYVTRMGQTAHTGTLLMVDIDGFKPVNDRLGHLDGDQVLCRVVTLIEATLTDEDCLYRLGGDEFAVVLPVQATPGRARAETLRRAVERGFGNHKDPLTVSVGLVGFTPGICIEDVIHGADMALYRAKRGGRNRVEVGTPQPRPNRENLQAGPGQRPGDVPGTTAADS